MFLLIYHCRIIKLFDVKDVEEDSYYGSSTIPNVLGIRIAKFVSIGSLLLSTLIYSQNTHFEKDYLLMHFL